MTDAGSFSAVTARYEAWRADRIRIVADDLRHKHAVMADSPFVLLRGSYYRFLQAYGPLLPELASAPPALTIGDLHIENFGTWRDRAGRLGWGINDFDEIDVLPYTIDLVRLGTSALLAIGSEHLSLTPKAACAALLEGWMERMHHGPAPFVLGERHAHLYRLASDAIPARQSWAHQLRALAPWEGQLPKHAARAVAQITPWAGWSPTLHRRVAGVGSLGSRRIVLIDDLDGGLLAREVKQIPGPASRWLWPKVPARRGLPELVEQARGVQSDPGRHQSGKWVARSLSPDATRLELDTLPRKRDEATLLRDMGAETANIHLVATPGGASTKALIKDATRRRGHWLHAGAAVMASLTEADHAAWVKRS